MKKFNGYDIINNIRAIIKRGEGIDSHYGNGVSKALRDFDVASQMADYEACSECWKKMTKDERLVVLTIDLHPIIEQVKDAHLKVNGMGTLHKLLNHPYYFGFLDLHDKLTIPSEFVEWFCEEIEKAA